MGIIAAHAQLLYLFVLFLAPRSVARGGSVAYMDCLHCMAYELQLG